MKSSSVVITWRSAAETQTRNRPGILNCLCHWERKLGEVRKPLVHDLLARLTGLHLLLQLAKNSAVLRKLSPIQVQLLDLGGVLVDEFVERIGRLHDIIFTQTRCGFHGNIQNE